MSLPRPLDTKLQEDAVRDGNCNSEARCTPQSSDNTHAPQQHAAPGFPCHREGTPDGSNLRMKGFISVHSIRDGWRTWHESPRKIEVRWESGAVQCEGMKRGRGSNSRNPNELGGKGRRPGTVTKTRVKDFLLHLKGRRRGLIFPGLQF